MLQAIIWPSSNNPKPFQIHVKLSAKAVDKKPSRIAKKILKWHVLDLERGKLVQEQYLD